MNRTTATVGAGCIAAAAAFGGIALAVSDDGPLPSVAGNSAAVGLIDCDSWTVTWSMLGPGTATGTFSGDVPAAGERSGAFPDGLGGSVTVGFDISSPRDGVPEATASASTVEQCAPVDTEPEPEDTEPEGTEPTTPDSTTPDDTTPPEETTTTTTAPPDATTTTTTPPDATTTTVATTGTVARDDITEVIVVDCAEGSHQVGEGCLLDEQPPAHVKVCRDGRVVEISYANVRPEDSLNLASCGAAAGLPSTQ